MNLFEVGKATIKLEPGLDWQWSGWNGEITIDVQQTTFQIDGNNGLAGVILPSDIQASSTKLNWKAYRTNTHSIPGIVSVALLTVTDSTLCDFVICENQKVAIKTTEGKFTIEVIPAQTSSTPPIPDPIVTKTGTWKFVDAPQSIAGLDNISIAINYRNYVQRKVTSDGGSDQGTRQALVDFADLGLDIADESYSDGNLPDGDQALDIAWGALDFALDFAPGISAAKDIISVATGINPITGEPISDLERGILTASLLVPSFLSGTTRAIGKAAAKVKKIYDEGRKSRKLAKDINDAIKDFEKIRTVKGIKNLPEKVEKWAKNSESGKTFEDAIKNWERKPAKRGDGVAFTNPERTNQQVRIMDGNPRNPNPESKVPHVSIQDSAGKSLDIRGNRVPAWESQGKLHPPGNRYHPDAHISIEDILSL